MNDILFYLDSFYKSTPLPVIATRDNFVIYLNPVAIKFFGSSELGYFARKYFPNYPYANGDVISTNIRDCDCVISVSGIDDVLIMTIIEQKCDEALSSIPIGELMKINHSVSTLFIATEKLSESCPENEKNEVYTSVLFQNFYKLLNTTDLLTAIAQLQAKQYPLTNDYVELGIFLADIVSITKAMLDNSGVSIEYVRPNNFVYVNADIELLKKVAFAIISNSISNTNSGNTITIKLTENLKDAIIIISDNGSGITPEKIASIFELNQVINDGIDVKHIGGLGLPFVSFATRAMGGTVVLNSAIDVGTSVSMSFKSVIPPKYKLNSPKKFYKSPVQTLALTSLSASLPREQYTAEKIFGR